MYIRSTRSSPGYTEDVFRPKAEPCKFHPMEKGRRDPALGQRIRELRQQLGDSQAVFGERFGVEQPTISRWEKGYLPERRFLGPLAQLAGVPEAEFVYENDQVRMIPLISWVAASAFTEMVPTRTIDALSYLTVGDLPSGDYFALSVQGDSMDRVAPDKSRIIVNRHEMHLQHRKFFIFEDRGSTTFKRAMMKPRLRLEPYSTNPSHEAIFPENPEEIQVLGRVVRVIHDL